MKIINNHSKEYLLERVETLRKGQAAWSAVYINLSRLKSPVQAHSLRATVHMIGAIPSTGDATLFVLPNHDLAVILPRVDSAAVGKIIDDVSFSFAEDTLAQTLIGGRGNALCTAYSSREDLVELHRVAVRLNSRAGAETVPAEFKPDEEKFRQAAATRSWRKKICILVAEDQPFSQRLVAQIIGDRFEILTADDGAHAVRLYAEHAPDIVFLDIDMPRMDGFAALSAIARLDAQAFVVMLTASQTQGDVQRALKSQARGYIIKPFTKSKIDQYIELYRKAGRKAGSA